MKRMSKSMFPDYTREFYKYLKFSKKEVFKGEKKERIKQLPIILQSMMGIGKTTLALNIIEKIQKWHGKDQCNVVYTKEFSLQSLMYLAFKGYPKLKWYAKKPIQIIIFDDATGIRLTSKTQRNFLSLRHLMFKDTKLSEGIVYSIFLTHDWYALDKTFRRNAVISCFLSIPPLDRYSRRDYSHYIGKQGVKFLEGITYKALKFDKYKGKGLVALPFKPNKITNIGFIKWKENPKATYLELRNRAETLPECIVHEMGEILYLHEPKTTKKITTKKQAQNYIKKVREQRKKRAKRHRDKMKRELKGFQHLFTQA